MSAVNWLQKHLTFSDEYFAQLIGVSQEVLCKWKSGTQGLESSQMETLTKFFTAMNRLLSFFNFRRDLMMRVLDFSLISHERVRSSFTPPWLGTSLRLYMLRESGRGIDDVDSWVQTMRSANSP